MIELVIDDEVINVPDEINLGIYQQINLNPDRYKNNLQLISLFTNLTVHELKNLKKDQVELIDAFIASKMVIPDEKELILTFEYDGVEYGLENDFSKMAFGAWVDLEVYSSEENIHQNLDKIMAVLYRPVISRDKKDPKKYRIAPYKSEEIEDRANIMKLVPVRYWLGLSGFFLQIVLIYTDNIKNSLSLMNKQQQMMMKGWKILPKWIKKRVRLDSILPSPTNWQKRILQGLKK